MNYSKRTIAAFAALAGLLYLPGTAFSQTTESNIDTSKVYELEEVIISASRYQQNPSTVGRNVTVISRREIENSIHYSAGDLLAEQQSLHIVGTGQTPGSLQQGFLRNANSNHSIVMIDGVPISDPSTVNDGIDLSELSLLGVERIEIVRGSHSTLYGSSAIGGVINIITREKGSKGVNVNVDTKHGAFGADTYSTSNNLLTSYTFDSGFYLNAGISQQYTRGLDATVDTVTASGVFNPQDQDNFKKLDALGKIGYQTSSTDLYLSYRNVDQSVDLDQAAYNDDNNAYNDFNRGLLGYGGSYELNKQLEVSFEGAYSDIARDFVNDSSVVDRQGNYDGTYVESNGRGTLWENELTASFQSSYSRLIVGAESSVKTMNVRNHTLVRPFNYESVTDLDSLDLKETINSAFVHVELNAGLIDKSADALSLGLGSRILDHNTFGTHLTYEINPKVQVMPSALIYGAVTTGFNAPSLYQLNSPVKGFGAFTTRGNTNLEPEKSISYELGFKQKIGGIVDFELSLFRTKVKDVIEYIYLWDGSTPVDNLTAGDYLGDTYINVSRQDVKGIEVGIHIQPSPKFSYGGNLTVMESTLSFAPDDIDESYTGGNHVQIFESGEFVNSKKELNGLTRRPQTSASIRAAYRPVQKLAVIFTSRFVGARDDIFYSANLGPFGAQDRSRIKGYNLTDIGVRYEITNRVSVTGKVENMLDETYREINGYQTRGRGFFLKASLSL